MALKRNERYPGRFTNPTIGHPQGAFQNRSSPTAQDGSYFESDWANDWSGFFESLLSSAGVTPNGDVDAVGSSQYYNALLSLGLAKHGNARLTTSGNFTVPAGVTTLYLSGCAGGGGGGGGGGSSAVVVGGGGSGGGAGQSVIKIPVTVTPGQTINVTIGAGGAGGTAGSSGGSNGGPGVNGGNTVFGSLLTLLGGGGGSAGQTGASNGAGGIGTTGYPIGSSGSDSVVNCGGGDGGSGGTSPYGGGGGKGRSGRPNGGPGFNAGGNGGGGGGGGGTYQYGPGLAGAGGNGTSGILIVEW